jgi:Na+/phosphate symporter
MKQKFNIEKVKEGDQDMEKIREQICQMCNLNKEMLGLAYYGLKNHSLKKIEEARQVRKKIHSLNEELTIILVAEKLSSFVGLPGLFEQIGSEIEKILSSIQIKIKEGLMLSDKAVAEVNILFEGTDELLECLRDSIKTGNKVLIQHIIKRINELNNLVSQYSTEHEERLIGGVCMPKIAPIYLDILYSLKAVNGLIGEITKRL